MANESGDLSRARRPDEPLLDSVQFHQLREVLARYSGVYIDDGRQRLLGHGVAQRLAATGAQLDAYLRRCVVYNDRRELHMLAEHVLNHETLFFRNMPHMSALEQDVLPTLHRQKRPGEPLRIWSAGCATGEEAYSLAITVLHTLGPPLARPVEIIGTDLSERALTKARAGAYRGRTLANVSLAQRARYFIEHGDTFVVNDDVRALVRFEGLNLLDPFPAWTHGIDLIFCQNVTIYFQLATCRDLMERFYVVLPDKGMLFLGFSETMWRVFNRFLTREIAGSFVYYKESSAATDNTGSASASKGGATNGPAPIQRRQERNAQRPIVAATPEQERSDEKRTVLRLPLVASDANEPPPAALRTAARAHADRNDLALALADALRARELEPLSAEVHVLLGLLYGRQGQHQHAIDQFERARYLDAAAPLPSFYLAEAYRQRGRAEAAVREYRNALHKLTAYPPDTLLDGVAVGWIRETCQRYVQQLIATKTREV